MNIKNLKLKDITLKNIKYFFQGYYFLILNKLNWLKLLFPYRKEQFEFRKQRVYKLNPKCIENKECIHCHCDTPALFLADKACELGCYPEIMNNKNWKISKERQEYLNNKK